MPPPTHRTAPWFVYILRCADGTLYTGITTDLSRRVIEHNETLRGARYTRPRRPVRLVYAEGHQDRAEASRREHSLKALSRGAKEALIEQTPSSSYW